MARKKPSTSTGSASKPPTPCSPITTGQGTSSRLKSNAPPAISFHRRRAPMFSTIWEPERHGALYGRGIISPKRAALENSLSSHLSRLSTSSGLERSLEPCLDGAWLSYMALARDVLSFWRPKQTSLSLTMTVSASFTTSCWPGATSIRWSSTSSPYTGTTPPDLK